LGQEETSTTHPLASTLLVPRDYESFAGLDGDKSIQLVTFTDHVTLVWSLRMPYSSEHLLNYARKHFAGRKLAFAYEAGPTGFGLYEKLAAEGHRCLGVAPQVVPTALSAAASGRAARQPCAADEGD
jgi:hypothetical protein